MKQTKHNRFLAAVLTFSMVFSMCGVTASAEPAAYGIRIYHGSAYTEVTSDNSANVLGDGTVSYDAAANTLTLNNANLTYENTDAAVISASKDGEALNLNLVGQNTITADRCINAKPNLVITGNGALEIQGGRSALYASNNLTIDGPTVNADVTGTSSAIQSGGILSIKNSENITVSNASGSGIVGAEGIEIINSSVTSTVTDTTTYSTALLANGEGLTITDSTVNVSITNGTGIFVGDENGSIHITGSTVVAETSAEYNYAIGSNFNVIEISDSKVEAIATGIESNGIFAGGSLVVTNQSDVNVSSTFPALYSETGTTISDSTVDATSSDDVSLFSKADVRIENGSNVTADGYWAAIRGNENVTISDSKVDATSKEDVAIFAPNDLQMIDSIVSAKGKDGLDGIKVNQTAEVSGSWVSTSGNEAFAGSTNYVLINKVAGIVIGNAVLPDNVTIPADTMIQVPSDSSLTIPENVTLTNDGTVNVEGEILNYGIVICNNHSGGTATCTTKAACGLCGQEYGSPNGHKMQKMESKAPTCTEDGNMEYWHCTVCDKNFADEQGKQELDNVGLPALGHKLQKVESKEPTCTGTGNVEYWHCTECDKNFADEQGKEELADTGVSVLGHKAEKVEAKEPTATTPGNIEHWHCPQCGQYFKDADLTEIILKEDTVIGATGGTAEPEPEQPTTPSEPEQPTKPSEPSKPEQPARPSNPAEPPKETPNTGTTGAVPTGDNVSLALWIMLTGMGIAGAAGTVHYKARRNGKQ